MGIKGAMRSGAAMYRRMELAAERERRANIKQQERERKLALLGEAARLAEEWNQHIDDLVSLHREVPQGIDWQAAANVSDPVPPQPTDARQLAAQSDLENYRPGFFARLLRLEKRHIERLQQRLQCARQTDEDKNRHNAERYASELERVRSTRELALRIMKPDIAAWGEFMEEHMQDIGRVGRHMQINFTNARVTINLFANGPEVIPPERATLLKSGQLSLKAIPKAERWGLYQDHVCSAVIRVAVEVLFSLPVAEVEVNVYDNAIDQSTGHQHETRILTALFPRQELFAINLPLADASECVTTRFQHAMDFKPSRGFRPLQEEQP